MSAEWTWFVMDDVQRLAFWAFVLVGYWLMVRALRRVIR